MLSSGNQSETPVNLDELGRLLPQLAGPSPIASGAARLLETGIKVIDVMCPLVAGGNAIIAGELCNPTYTLYELTHRLKDGPDGLKLFALLQVQGFVNAYAGIALPNDASVALHEAMGMTAVGVYRGVGWKLGAWRDVGWWARRFPTTSPPLPPRAPAQLAGDAAWQALLAG